MGSNQQRMNSKEFKDFMEAQRKEIAKHKWLASEKAGRDLGQEAVLDWVKHHARDFRVRWEEERKQKEKGEAKKKAG